MAGYSFTKLSLTGYNHKPLPNTYLRQNEPPAPEHRSLGVLFPGLHYSNQMPLLYYTAAALLQLGADVLEIDTDYSGPEFQNAPQEQQAAWLAADARAAVETARRHGQYRRLVLAGKSLGTLSIAHLISDELPQNTVVLWLTPLLHLPPLVETIKGYPGPSLFIAGTADPACNLAALAEIQEANGAEAFLAPNANHSLEIPGDIVASIQQMKTAIEAMQVFLKKHL